MAMEKLSTKWDLGSIKHTAPSDFARFRSHWPEIELLSIAAVVGPTIDTAIYLEFISTGHRGAISRGNVSITSTDLENLAVINSTRYD